MATTRVERISQAIRHLESGKLADARALLEPLRRAAPTSPLMRILWGEVLMRADNNPAGAIAEARAVLADEPDNHHAHMLVAAGAGGLGDKALAVASLKRALTLKPDLAEAHLRLARAAPEACAPYRARIEALAAAAAATPKDRSQALSALGLLRQREQDYAGAYQAFLASKQATSAPYDAEGYELSLARSRARFTAELFEPAPAAPLAPGEPPRPLFIVGLPRSGSTLLERMLCRHSRIVSAGETAELCAVLERFCTEPAVAAARTAGLTVAFREIEGVLGADQATRRRAAAAYLARLERLLPERGGPVWIDKMPANLFLCGAAAALFPEARFLITDRDPRATFISALQTRFAGPQPFSESPERFAHYYKMARAFTALWRTRLGERVAVARYEDLVRAPETEMRRLIAHLGLGWEAACGDAGPAAGGVVNTASNWQVRAPVHTGSVGAWRRYAGQLGPLEALLGDGAAPAAAAALGTGALSPEP